MTRSLPDDPRDIHLTFTHTGECDDDPDDSTLEWEVSADVVDTEPVFHVGDINIFSVALYGPGNPFELLDAHTHSASRVGEAIFDTDTGDLVDELEETFEFPGGRVLVVDRAELVPEWRGFGLGAWLTGRAIRVLSPGARLAACYPAPLAAPDKATFELGRAKLGPVWGRLGFEHFRNGVYVLDPNLVTLRNAVEEMGGHF